MIASCDTGRDTHIGSARLWLPRLNKTHARPPVWMHPQITPLIPPLWAVRASTLEAQFL